MRSMKRFAVHTLLAALALVISAAASAHAQTAPAASPTPSPAPSPFTYSGYVRSYYFTRQNASSYVKTNSQFNQASFNTGISLHAAYQFSPNWSVGGTYLYADPLNGCANPATHLDPTSPCYKSRKFTSPAGGTNPDDTLPGFRLSTLYEAFLQYKDPSLALKLGDQLFTTPWANTSDSRIKPMAFRGGDATYKFSSNWSGELAYMTRFEDRTQSDFLNSDLLAQNGSFPDAPGVGNTGIPKGGVASTNGFGYARIGYAAANLTANAHYYAFSDIANALWADAKYSWKTYAKPFVALQGGTESSTGRAIVGKIASQVFGVQAGITPWKNVDLAISYNYIPQKSDTIALPAGATCSTHDMIGGTLQYFLPSGGTPNCHTNSNGTTTVYYGGWASPYTDSYATDPLFTTTISQGMADRRSPGSAVKIAGTFTLFNSRIKFIAAHAWYAYGNATAGVAPTQETNFDGTYYFNPVGKGPYHGFSLRHRYAERTQQYTAVYGGLPLFRYNRTQLEYDF